MFPTTSYGVHVVKNLCCFESKDRPYTGFSFVFAVKCSVSICNIYWLSMILLLVFFPIFCIFTYCSLKKEKKNMDWVIYIQLVFNHKSDAMLGHQLSSSPLGTNVYASMKNVTVWICIHVTVHHHLQSLHTFLQKYLHCLVLWSRPYDKMCRCVFT